MTATKCQAPIEVCNIENSTSRDIEGKRQTGMLQPPKVPGTPVLAREIFIKNPSIVLD
ncbi:hypothetical protein [Thalassobacillus sp. C254]|uniref:hypothetical protein n=1 Tax=Thalassobacillus sp. C254 TaxID=1225341 RepID=UPI0012EDAB9E|nr:hypothetical protein [Thalassobacillus sp. C254]